MAVKRQKNWLGQQRVDIPHLREIESAVVNDFDDLAGKILASGQPLIVYGMTIAMGAAVGVSANQLVLNTANAILLHATASEAGTLFVVPSNQPADTLNSSNPNVIGSFTPNATNYIGIDLVRVADSTTDDTVKFRSATTRKEFSQQVPLARVLQYRIVISTDDFSLQPSVAPVAKVAVDVNSLVTSVTDCREMMFRLGTGGTAPDPLAVFSWPGGRSEQPSTSTSTADPFTGADKSIYSFTDFFRALESRLWEVGGGEHWYSATTDRDLQLVRDPASIFASDNDNFEWTGTNLHWRGLSFIFGNSTAAYNYVADQLVDSAGLTDLAVGDAIYVDLDRAANHGSALNTPNPGDLVPLVVHKTTLQNLGTPAIPGSRQLIAWRTVQGVFARGSNLNVGGSVGHATASMYGIAKLYSATGTDAIVPAVDASGVIAARGISRDAAGTLSLGTGANDTEVDISKAGALTHIFGTLTVDQAVTLSSGGTSTTSPVDTNTTAIATTAFVLAQAGSATPLMNGGAAVGTSTRYARQDHVHPTDTTRAPLASPTFTGTPAAPTAAVDTNTTQLATTAFVLAQASSTLPYMDGTATIGTSTRYARADHIHPTDTSRAALASPTFTGTPSAPTAAQDTNTTQLATTAFVVAQASSSTPLANGGAAIGTSLRYARADHVHPAATPYTLPPATSVSLGGVIVPGGSNLSLDGSGNLTLTGANVESALGYTPVTNARTINGYDLTANRTLTAPDVLGVRRSGMPKTGGGSFVEDHDVQIGWTGMGITPNTLLRWAVDGGTVGEQSGYLVTSNTGANCDLDALFGGSTTTLTTADPSITLDFQKVRKGPDGITVVNIGFTISGAPWAGNVLTMPAGFRPVGVNVLATGVRANSGSPVFFPMYLTSAGVLVNDSGVAMPVDSYLATLTYVSEA